jgi:hypothetical protein
VRCRADQRHPAIAYQESTNYLVKYAYSTTPTGSQAADWTVITVPTPTLEARAVHFAGRKTVRRRPARYGRRVLLSPRGNADRVRPGDWTTRRSAFIAGGNFSDLAVVNGNPAVVYRDDADYTRVYCRSSSANGDEAAHWSNKVVIDGGAGNYLSDASLAVIEGNPAVAYSWEGMIDTWARYCRSSTATGAGSRLEHQEEPLRTAEHRQRRFRWRWSGQSRVSSPPGEGVRYRLASDTTGARGPRQLSSKPAHQPVHLAGCC